MTPNPIQGNTSASEAAEKIEGNRTGAPCSPQRTWAENDRRSPAIAFIGSIKPISVKEHIPGREIVYTRPTSRSIMSHHRNRRRLNCIAVVAILFCLVLLLLPHPCGPDAPACFLLIPLLFIGITTSHRYLSRMAYLRLGNVPVAPALPPAFERPPPFRFV